MPTMIHYECAHCGRTFERQKGRHEASKTGLHFCGRDCVKAWRRGENHPGWKGAKRSYVCDECGSTFERFPDHARGERIFCNAKCHGAWASKHKQGENNHNWKGKLQVSCDYCGATLERYRSQVDHGPRNFCDTVCRSNWLSEHNVGPNNVTWKGGYGDRYYGPNWLRQAREARRRDSHQCQRCGISETQLGRKLDVHHIIPFASFGYIRNGNDNYKQANKLNNLISLCPACHTKAEHGKIPLPPSLL